MKKRNLFFLLLIFLTVVSLIGSSFIKQTIENTKFPMNLSFSNIHDIFKDDLDNVTKLLMRSGSTGEAHITSDKVKINEFFSIMSKAKFTKHKSQKLVVGFTYYVDLFEESNEKEWFRIGFTRVSFGKYINNPNYKTVNSPYYLIENESEIMNNLDKFYISLNTE